MGISACHQRSQRQSSHFICFTLFSDSPGRKDYVVSWQNGKDQEHLQKRHLLFSLKEVHAACIFLKENPVVNIGLSKFSCLHPINVFLSSNMLRNICKCYYHDDIKLICDCLSKRIPEFPSYSSDTEECMLGKCIKCPN